MDINTHEQIDRSLCGEPVSVFEGGSEVRMECTANMAADASGLIHGGFIFGMADYAAMLTVNHPNVVLAGAESRFLKLQKSVTSLLPKPASRKRMDASISLKWMCPAMEKLFSAALLLALLLRNMFWLVRN